MIKQLKRLKQYLKKIFVYIQGNKRKVIVLCFAFVLAAIVIFQLSYPSDRLVFFTKIDGIELGGWNKKDATDKIDGMYEKQPITVYFGVSNKVSLSMMPVDIGLKTSNESRINNIVYPWYLRLVPMSILWVHILNNNHEPDYQINNNMLANYIDSNLGTACSIQAVDARLEVVEGDIKMTPSIIGVDCNKNDVINALSSIKPMLHRDTVAKIVATETMPVITDEIANNLMNNIKKSVGSGINISSDYSSSVIPNSTVYEWIDFSADGDKISYSLNESRASDYLHKEYLSILSNDYQSIISSNTSSNFSTKVNMVNSKLNVSETLANIKNVVDGSASQTSVVVELAPSIIADSMQGVWDDAAFAKVLSQYAESHPGVYGVAAIELSRQSRRAEYNGSHIFTTASTYKLFVAYSTLLRIESGDWRWSDNIINGKDLSTCFDDMIIRSDNDCAATMLAKVGYRNITNEAVAVGCTDTSFVGNDGIKTTANDLALLLGKLQTGQILDFQPSRDLLINAMKKNIYRLGIPSGVNGAIVADKVGFMDNMLHDASIVYSPHGNYVLVIMTEDSSWATIADFASQIEAYHAK